MLFSNDSKLYQMVQNSFFKLKWFHAVQEGTKGFKRGQNSSRWFKIVRTYWMLFKMAQKCKSIQNGSKWFKFVQMVQIGPKWNQMG